MKHIFHLERSTISFPTTYILLLLYQLSSLHSSPQFFFPSNYSYKKPSKCVPRKWFHSSQRTFEQQQEAINFSRMYQKSKQTTSIATILKVHQKLWIHSSKIRSTLATPALSCGLQRFSQNTSSSLVTKKHTESKYLHNTVKS